jgi:hypothetical protein
MNRQQRRAEAAMNRKSQKAPTEYVYARYWYKDNEDGFSVSLCRPAKSINEMEEMIMDGYKGHDSAEEIKTYFEQLDFLSNKIRTEGFNDGDQILAVSNIVYLTNTGHLPNDNFNGVSYMYGSRKDLEELEALMP